MKTLLVALFAISLAMTACGRSEPTPTPTATTLPTSTNMPTATAVPTDTPVPTVALPTPTPSPTPDPAALFLDWLDTNGYRFIVDVRDGSKRYGHKTEDDDLVIDVYPNRVMAWNIVFDGQAEAVALYESTNIVIAALDIRDYDTQPIRAALAAPYQYPLTLQQSGYIFLLEKEDSDLFSTITASATFFDSE